MRSGSRRLLRVLLLSLASSSLIVSASSTALAQVDVGDWIVDEIGFPATEPGTARIEDDDCFVIETQSRDVSFTVDQATFVYQEVEGDVVLQSRIARADGAVMWAKVGVMLRESLDESARFGYSMIDVSDVGGFQHFFQWRPEVGANDGSTRIADPLPVFPDAWVRIDRRADTLIGFYSVDGVDWVEFGSFTFAEPLPETILAGIVATNQGNFLETEVCDVELSVLSNQFPRAAFSADPLEGVAPLTVSFDASASTDAEDAIVRYDWDFGDGEVDEGVTVEHTYSDGGAFTVTLTVTDDAGNTSSAQQTISVLGSIDDWSVGEIGVPTAPATVAFEDGCFQVQTTSRDLCCVDDQATFIFQEVDGDVRLQARITRADGAATWGKVGVHLRESLAPGSRHGYAMVDLADVGWNYFFTYRPDLDVETGDFRVLDPVPVFPDVYLRIQRQGDTLLGSYSGDGANWIEMGRWTFLFPLPDTLLAGLAFGNHGQLLDAEVCDVELTAVDNLLPTAAFTASVDSGPPPLDVDFDASESTDPENAIALYRWDFGDGETGEGVAVSHTYTDPGVYTVTLTVVDDAGNSSSAQAMITVRESEIGDWIIGDIGFPDAGPTIASFDGDCFQVHSSARDIAGTTDQASFIYQEVDGDVLLQAQIANAEGAVTWGKVGVMIRETLEESSRFGYAMIDVTPDGFRFFFTWRSVFGGADGFVRIDDPLPLFPDVWVRIQRQGDALIGFFSIDGADWLEFGRHVFEEPLPDDLLAGIGISNQTNPIDVEVCEVELAEVTNLLPEAVIEADPVLGAPPLEVSFDASDSVDSDGQIVSYAWDFGDGESDEGRMVNHTYEEAGSYTATLTVTDDVGNMGSASTTIAVAPQLDGWFVGEIGIPNLPATVTLDDDCFRIQSSSRDICCQVDQATFIFQEVEGDVTVQARVDRADGAVTWGKVGLMVRESLDGRSRFSFSMIDVTNEGFRYFFTWRPQTGANDGFTRIDEPLPTFPDVWLRIERQEDTILGSASTDGADWQEFGFFTFEEPLAEKLLVGIAVSNQNNPIETDVCEVELVGDVAPPAEQFRRGDGNADGSLNLTDAVFALDWLFGGGPPPTCPDTVDTNDDGVINLTDPVFLLGFLFLGGPPPEAPGGESCGPDPTRDDFEACVYRACA